ncbi:hypothetical protein EDB82DRAFT_540564 [Fusarium venenatum]|uniref:uncharacterized protein n=1 Tax=Fusarium venenatum TaxID=56646 RepID=UPI001D647A6F|nr:hypothetical protein EDB82DRAFT_540564 [Fusarium venenatum]
MHNNSDVEDKGDDDEHSGSDNNEASDKDNGLFIDLDEGDEGDEDDEIFCKDEDVISESGESDCSCSELDRDSPEPLEQTGGTCTTDDCHGDECEGVFHDRESLLLAHADVRIEEDILSYNLRKLALRSNYNGVVKYREGVKCPGPCEALTCASEQTISLTNTVLQRRMSLLSGSFYQAFMQLPMVCEKCGALMTLIKTMFKAGRWIKPGSDHSGTCDSPDCQEPVGLGTQLCNAHALKQIYQPALCTTLQNAVQETLSKKSVAAIRMPQEALEFFTDPKRGYEEITSEETNFLRDLKDKKDREVVSEGFVNHGCETVEDIWAFAANHYGRKLKWSEERTRRKAFGYPSSKKLRGHNMTWVKDEWLELKAHAPHMRVAEWSKNPFNQNLYRENLTKAGFNPDEVLPPPFKLGEPDGMV